MIHFHKWKYLVKENSYCFEGKLLYKMVPAGYRVCTKCGVIQSYNRPFWENLTDGETEIIQNEINEGRFKYKGNNNE